jgi:phage tail sheath protein FI
MAVKVSYPGVYIEEFAPGAPIEGAATNIAAILGPLADGPVITTDGPPIYRLPPRITSLDQFKQVFGSRPAPGFFTWYAVRGFFENGGTAVYVYRVSNARYARTDLVNRAGVKLGEVLALRPGQLDVAITFEVRPPATPLLPAGTKLFAAEATGDLVGSTVTIPASDPGDGPPTDARAFRVGDMVQLIAPAGPLGSLVRVKSATTTGIVVDETRPDTPGVKVRLIYDSVVPIRVQVPDPTKLSRDAFSTGMMVVLGDPADVRSVVDVVDSSGGEQLTAKFKTYRLTLRNGLRAKIDPVANETPVSAVTFDVAVSQGGGPYLFTNLAPDPASNQYYVDTINQYPSLVQVVAQDPPPAVRRLDDLRPDFRAFSVQQGGQDEDLDNLSDTDFTTALDNLRRVGDVRLVSLPDGYPRADGLTPKLTAAVHAAAIAHCEQMADRFAVLDPEPNLGLFGAGSIETRRAAVDSERGYAALYYPWVRVPRAGVGPLVTVPPSGHICGMMANVDNTKGVFKAPANEILQGTVGVQQTMTDAEHGLLNLQGINIIRVFKEGGRPYVYGARTTATNSSWQYVNVRRLFLYLEKSIQDGIRWAVFEPNNLSLWDKLKQTISAFLLTEWRAGALFGASPKQAYYVRIDETLNPFSERSLGKLHIEIGIQPTYPAEFIIVRIGIWDGGAEVTEA